MKPAPHHDADHHANRASSDSARTMLLPTRDAMAAPAHRRANSVRIGRRVLAPCAALVVGVVWALRHVANAHVPIAKTDRVADWDIELSSSAATPVRALVFGWGAGIHVVTVPRPSDGAGAEHRVAARLPTGGAAYVISLGSVPVDVRAHIIGGSLTRSVHRTRFIRVFQNADGSGVRTVSY